MSTEIHTSQPSTPLQQEAPALGEFEYDIQESRQTQYQIWKKNSKHLYEYLNTNTCKWPSLSVQIFPDIQESQCERRLLLSQFTSGQIPQDETVYLSSISTGIPISSINNFEMDYMEFHLDSESSKKGKKRKLNKNIEIQFPVGEECNRTRYMYSNPDVIGSASSKGYVYIHNKTKCLSNSITTSFEFKLEPVGAGSQELECLSLSWNFQKNGILANCNNDGNVYVWDLNKIYTKNNGTDSSPSFESRIMIDQNGCNDVSWMVHHTSIVAAACESKGLQVIDTRNDSTIKASSSLEGQNCNVNNALNSVQFNWQNDLLLCTGSASGTVAVWDLRDLSGPLKELHHGANSPISNAQWNPNLTNIIASAGLDDGLVKLWDTAAGYNGAVQNEENLIFTHGGHMLGCNDISWDFHDEWLLASVSNDNSIHVWKPSKGVIDEFYV